jgi:Flp pilus assembly protein TadG
MLIGFKRLLKDEQGVGAALGAICLMATLGITALALDIGHLVAAKEELQRAADAGALAGARGLWPLKIKDYETVNPRVVPDCTLGYNAALSTTISANNEVNGEALTGDNLNIEVGHYNFATHIFTAQPGCAGNSNAVRVRAQRDINNVFFAQIWNITFFRPAATSTAVMGFAKGVGKGTLPIAINKDFVVPGTDLYINFNPDPNDNAGWFADPPDRAGAATFRDYINNASCPPLSIGDIINLQNGQDTSALEALRVKLEEEYPNGWDTYLPVVNTDKFNQSQPIMGFVPFRILEVRNGSDKGVFGKVLGLAQSSTGLPGSEQNYGVLAPVKAVN